MEDSHHKQPELGDIKDDDYCKFTSEDIGNAIEVISQRDEENPCLDEYTDPNDLPKFFWNNTKDVSYKWLAEYFSRIMDPGTKEPKKPAGKRLVFPKRIIIPYTYDNLRVENSENEYNINDPAKYYSCIYSSYALRILEHCLFNKFKKDYPYEKLRMKYFDSIIEFADALFSKIYPNSQENPHPAAVFQVCNAFDEMSHKLVYTALHEQKIRNDIIYYIRKIYSNVKMVVQSTGGITEEFQPHRGLAYDSILSIWIYRYVMDYILEELNIDDFDILIYLNTFAIVKKTSVDNDKDARKILENYILTFKNIVKNADEEFIINIGENQDGDKSRPGVWYIYGSRKDGSICKNVI